MIYNWSNFALNLIYPPTCMLCGNPGQAECDLCAGCLAELPRNLCCCPICAIPLPNTSATAVCGSCLQQPPGFDACHTVFLYTRPITRLISELKFHNGLSQARLLARLLGDSLQTAGIELPSLLVPVPLHPARLRQRGYNQALELARPLSRRFGIPLDYKTCTRPHAAPPQVELSKKARRRNVKKVFAVSRHFDALHVALVDDVVTTGATVSALARLLKKNGVQRVDIWAVARTP